MTKGLTMIFCRGCGKQIHETAPTCPGCGAVQDAVPVATGTPAASTGHWMSITSLVAGIFCLLCTFDDSGWDRDEVTGFLLVLITSVALGALSLGQRKAGKRMAVAGVVVSAIALLLFLGSL
jgi:hypothetical protein